MFLKILFNYILGYVNIKVEGYYIERFINICINKKILLWNSKRIKSSILCINIGIKDFRKIREIARITKCRINIEIKKGLPFILNRYRKRKLFFACLLSIVLMLIISSNYVWNIEIVGNSKIPTEEIIKSLNENGLQIGKNKKDINTKQIINGIRLNRNDIAWVGISLDGTNAVVEVVEAEIKPEIVNPEEYCNIVSNREGIITKITAGEGTALVKEGDLIKHGTVLVAGWMEGKYTGIRYVHARGDIEAKVWYTKSKKAYYTEEIDEKTGDIENKYTISINNLKINLYKTLSKFETYDTINEEKKLKLFSNFYLPIKVDKTTNIETRKVNVSYTYEELLEKTTKELENDLNIEIGNPQNVVNKQINTYSYDEYIEVEVIYEVIEKIGTEEKIIF